MHQPTPLPASAPRAALPAGRWSLPAACMPECATPHHGGHARVAPHHCTPPLATFPSAAATAAFTFCRHMESPHRARAGRAQHGAALASGGVGRCGRRRHGSSGGGSAAGAASERAPGAASGHSCNLHTWPGARVHGESSHPAGGGFGVGEGGLGGVVGGGWWAVRWWRVGWWTMGWWARWDGSFQVCGADASSDVPHAHG
eukprot:358984-Chlamydomonas_euryale.AAC.1